MISAAVYASLFYAWGKLEVCRLAFSVNGGRVVTVPRVRLTEACVITEL
jgi:hypothetical protein